MPAKKTHSNESILIDESEFKKAEQTTNQELECFLTALMERANKSYDIVYRAPSIN
ncbi:MAG: hypothetical protein WAL30_01185 [Candidatus Aquirickettsiella sp.]